MIFACRYKFIKFIGRQFCEMPLVTSVIIIIHVIINYYLNISKCYTISKLRLYMVFHMTEEAFLWCIIPTIASAGHRLSEIFIMYYVNKLVTGIMAALI